MKPLENLVVLDFSQFLAGPAAAMRLADLGARVIKIERPGTGDICRQLYISNLGVEGDSTLFHSINRNTQGYAANPKDPADLEKIRYLISKADVLIENFRHGVMDKLGLGYEVVRTINPQLIYATADGHLALAMGSIPFWENF
jgi:CoA:oxalate CoA-transferase